MKWQYCYVLNYSSVEILEITLDEQDNKAIEDGREEEILYRRNLSDSECSWMYTKYKITNIINIDNDEHLSN